MPQVLPPDSEDEADSMTEFFALLEERRRGAGTSATVRLPGLLPPPVGEAEAHLIAALARTGLFDADYYLASYPDIAAAGAAPLAHFIQSGASEGRRPNPYFDTPWYLARHPDVAEGGLNPLFHYALHGEAEGRQPGPFFDPSWYRQQYQVPGSEIALAHWLRHRATGRFSPIPDFDVDFYLGRNPDVAAAGIDPFEHFWTQGYREGRNPSPEFDVRFYAQRYLRGDLSENPFAHWLAHRHEPGIHGRMPEDEATVPREVRRFTRPGPDFEEFHPLPKDAARRVRLLAYYLPQFHAFPQNDAWWGKGFTEWTNVPRGLPRFKGHYQPRVPRDLGFYSLEGNETFRRQVEMAKAGGVHGFVFYWYWFNGTRLLEKPVERFLADPSIDMPFALMWANENWTRRWDGAESEVLISQDYRPDDDDRMVAEFARHFRDPRYIRLGGRPLLMVYRAALIPEAKSTIARWRHLFREQHGEEPLLVMAQGFGDTDPRPYGLDGAIEFPPHKLTQDLPPTTNGLELLDTDFSGKVYRYEDVARVSLDEKAPDFPLIRTAVPSWDNDARRQGSGLTITDSTPAKYEAWLAALIEHAGKHPFHGEAIVCVNAWNEWCEGAYLEPDLYFGSAYLNATGRAVTGMTRLGEDVPPRLLLVGHDAFPGGAQQLLLSIATTLRRAFGCDVEVLLLGGGAMEAAYRRIAPTTVVADPTAAVARIGAFAARGYRHAIVNTTAAGHLVPALRTAGIAATLLVHELPRLLREKHLEKGARAGISAARRVVFPAPFVRDEVLGALGLEADDRCILRPQGIYKDITAPPGAGDQVRAELGLGPEDRLVLGIGYADMRKGFDLFLQLWRLLRWRGRRPVHLCWIGGMDPGMESWLGAEIDGAKATGTFHVPGRREDVGAFLRAADAFALTSREDPFPSVALEALAVGLPVVAFERSGGIPGLLARTGTGIVVPYGDITAMSEAVSSAIRGEREEEERSRAKAQRQRLAASHFGWRPYVRDLLHMAVPDLPWVSVAVPNYNYARYMPERLGSVFAQSLPVQEVIVLDDCSTDDSLDVIRAVAARERREIRLEPNAANSGSVFAQWRKAAELAKGDFLWIAEADDLSDRDFLLHAAARLREDPAIRFAFTDSRTIHADGQPMWPDYKQYYATLGAGTLARSEVFEAGDFVRRFLSVKNIILNVSAVVWRRDALLEAMDACGDALRDFRMAGDWRLYLQALAAPGAKVAYEASPLNVHRRHEGSVTHALDAERHVGEIALCHDFARKAFAAEATAEAQRAYLAEVSAQFGVQAPAPARKRRAARRARSRAS